MISGFDETLIAIGSATVGSLLAALTSMSRRSLCALISFAAGALCATTLFHILPEAAEHISKVMIIIALVSGYLFFQLMSHHIFHVCPACAMPSCEKEVSS